MISPEKQSEITTNLQLLEGQNSDISKRRHYASPSLLQQISGANLDTWITEELESVPDADTTGLTDYEIRFFSRAAPYTIMRTKHGEDGVHQLNIEDIGTGQSDALRMLNALRESRYGTKGCDYSLIADLGTKALLHPGLVLPGAESFKEACRTVLDQSSSRTRKTVTDIPASDSFSGLKIKGSSFERIKTYACWLPGIKHVLDISFDTRKPDHVDAFQGEVIFHNKSRPVAPADELELLRDALITAWEMTDSHQNLQTDE